MVLNDRISIPLNVKLEKEDSLQNDKTDPVSEIKNELEKLRKQLGSLDED